MFMNNMLIFHEVLPRYFFGFVPFPTTKKISLINSALFLSLYISISLSLFDIQDKNQQ